MSIQAGINIFSVHRELGNDYFGTLEKVAQKGYKNIELIGFNTKKMNRLSDDYPASSVRDKFRELGLRAIAAHEGPMPGQDLLSHDWDSVMAYYEELGCETIVLPSVWVKDRESALATAEKLGVLGKKLKERGFRLYMHNHAHEFKRAGDTTLFELLAENTDPAHLKFEIDLVWVIRGGMDPIAVLERLGGRCDMIHQKDLNKRLAGPVSIFEAIAQNGDEGMDILEAYENISAAAISSTSERARSISPPSTTRSKRWAMSGTRLWRTRGNPRTSLKASGTICRCFGAIYK